jgi:hydrophobic/amphiphilic exporter-1 (mainly G- bacteria), HAE1 family
VSLLALFVRRPVAVWMVAIAAAVFGLVSYERLPLNLMPDLSYPTITVRTEVEGYAPEEVESQISRPVEEALATTQGLAEVESRSRAGQSDVVLEFKWGTDMDRAAQDVRERLQTTFLPDDAERPLILRYDPSLDPILRISLSTDVAAVDGPRGDAALYLLRDLADNEIKRELEAMDGVAAVRVSGGLEREVLVEVHQDWLSARGVTIEQVTATLGSENVNLPGGGIRDGDQEYLVRTLNEVRTVAEIEQLEVRRDDGVRVPIGHVATVREAHRDREVISLLDGREAVELEVFKAADANVVKVAAQVASRLGIGGTTAAPGAGEGQPDSPERSLGPPTLQSRLPAGVVMVVLENQASFIEAAIANLRSTAISGALLAVLVLYLFLRDFRATAIIATAIPLSVVVSFAPMYLGGVSLNLMSLGGLALGIGMLVDNAVVVLENIQVHIDAGQSRAQAAISGVTGVAAAVIASTLTTVAVFLPITFVEGIAGQVFGDLSLAVVFSLMGSLVVALCFVPMLAASDLRLPDVRPRLLEISPATRFRSFAQLRGAWRGQTGLRRLLWAPYWLVRWVVRFFFELVAVLVAWPSAVGGRLLAGVGRPVYEHFADAYGRRLDWLLMRPGVVLGATAAVVLLVIPIGGQLGRSLIPEVHQGRFTAELSLPVGTPLHRTQALVRSIEGVVRALPEVEHVHATIGSARRADSRPDEGEHTARLGVEMTAGGDLAAREERLMVAVRDSILTAAAAVDGRAQLDVRLVRPSLFSFSTPVEVVVYGDDLTALRFASDRMTPALADIDGLTDVRSSLTEGYPEIRLRYDRDLLHRFGLTTTDVAQGVRSRVQGDRATTVSRGDGRVDLLVRLAEDDRRGVDDLRRVNVNPAVNPPIPLEAVARVEEAEGPSEVRRIDQRRAAVISANLDGLDLSGRADAISATLGALDLGGVEWEVAGQNREMQRSQQSLELALALAVFLVYVIMASTFESVVHPFVILFTLPLALIGVAPTLLVANTPISVVVFIGAIVLAGVVVNNAIVLVDAINQNRAGAEGPPMDIDDAIRTAARQRLRPILITTLTTVLGLLPLAMGLGEGAEVQRPLALTIIAGLSSSTLLTLLVIPALYRVVARAVERVRPVDQGLSPATD